MTGHQRRTIGLSALAGIVAGILAGLGEVAHLAWFVPGIPFPPILMADAAVIDGGLGLLAGCVVGLVWAFVTRNKRPAEEPLETVAVAHCPLSRRSFLRVAGASVALAGAVGSGTLIWQTSGRRAIAGVAPLWAANGAAAGGASRPPNILFITIDTLRADQLGVYGHPYMSTPALDAFAAQGARFNWHMVQQPQTNPSHASMFTGMYPASSGIRVHMVDKIPDQQQTLAKVFANAGFATAGLFSWMSFDNQYCNFQPGFQVYQDLTNAISLLDKPGVRDVGAQYRVAEQYLSVPRALNQITGLQEQQEAAGKGHADVTTSAAISQLSAFGSQPFFMWLHYYDPHYPYQPPDSYLDLYDAGYQGPMDDSMSTIDAIQAGKLQPQGADLQRLMSFYQAEITFLDSQIVRLFQTLDSMGLTQNTVVAITGDHGESFGEHTQFEENGSFFHPHSLYNSEQRVPLLLRYPDRIQPGAVISAPTQAIDVFPTLLGLAGLSVPDQAQGRDVVSLLDGSDDGSSRASFAAMPDYVFTSVTVPGWKLMRNLASGEQRLFNLTDDPNEQQDLLAGQQDVGTQLGTQLQGWMKDVKIS
ncbi:MAG TPA: sulfatase [Chloroflexota bacterium]|nr:sulfatase [Chloroflexota bacterium]